MHTQEQIPTTSPALLVTQGISNTPCTDPLPPPIPLDDRTCSSLRYGIDTLHLGLHIDWGFQWPEIEHALAALRVRALNTRGIPGRFGNAEPFTFYPKGLGSYYRNHLKFSGGDFYFSNTPAPCTCPNGVCWVDNWQLLERGVINATTTVTNTVAGLGGRVVKAVPSRVDLFVDLHIPGGLAQEFLDAGRVAKKQKRRVIGDQNDVLETYYVGKEGATITARIYDKPKELQNHYPIEGVGNSDDQPATDIWRVEFQVLRPALQGWKINSVDDLLNKIGDVWKYLTSEWLRFCEQDNPHVSRRTVQSWWKVVQEIGPRLGPISSTPLRRTRGNVMPDKMHLVRLIAGCLANYAARIGESDPARAWQALGDDVKNIYRQQDFNAKYEAKRAELGMIESPRHRIEVSSCPQFRSHRTEATSSHI